MEKLKIYRAIKYIKNNELDKAATEIKETLLHKISKRVKKIKENVIFEFNAPCLGYRPLSEIAQDIEKNWKNPSASAVPYIKAMKRLNLITESYYKEDGKNIVAQFLANSLKWRGEKATEIKAELKAMLVGRPVNELKEACNIERTEEEDKCPYEDMGSSGKCEFKMKDKPPKVNGKYLLKDENANYEDDNVLANTSDPKGVSSALKQKWVNKIDYDTPQFGATVIYKGKSYNINFLGHKGNQFKAVVANKPVVGETPTELYNNVVAAITGSAPTMESKNLSISYTDFVTEWIVQKEIVSGHRPKEQFGNFDVAYEFDEADGFLRKIYEDVETRNKVLTEHLNLSCYSN